MRYPGVFIIEIKYQILYQRRVAQAAWILLILCLLISVGKEAFTIWICRLSYLRRWDTYRNLAKILSIILIIYQKRIVFSSSEISLARWQFHVASITCLLLWGEMSIIFGRIPVFGIYIHMFW